MKKMNKFAALFAMIAVGMGYVACSDECDYLHTNTSNPSYTEEHPEALTNTKWVRGNGMKYNAFGEEIQGFVESMDFFCADSVIVKMSEGCTAGTWVDDSNTESTPCYEYTYSASSGTVKVLKRVTNEKGAVSKTEIFTAVANIGKKNVMTVVHYGDTPVQSYLVKE